MFVTVTTIPVANEGQKAKIEENFKKNAPDLKEFDGFIGFEFWKQENEIKAVAHWESREALDNYLNSDKFHQHHGNHEKSGGEASGHGHENGNGPKIDYYNAESFA